MEAKADPKTATPKLKNTNELAMPGAELCGNFLAATSSFERPQNASLSLRKMTNIAASI
ncbi:MAG: hypothetical protein PHD48_01730 [Alphaproteobacteria bacterium]|nr:hypothetical protein [Alphaproteobacteria bacterium]